jgi:hypothetical protein
VVSLFFIPKELLLCVLLFVVQALLL